MGFCPPRIRTPSSTAVNDLHGIHASTGPYSAHYAGTESDNDIYEQHRIIPIRKRKERESARAAQYFPKAFLAVTHKKQFMTTNKSKTNIQKI